MPVKFTRIKSNFSEHRRIPRLGRIKLGLKVKKIRQDGSSVEYPTETPHFIIPQEVQDVYGSKPMELDIMLPSDNSEDVFPQSLAWFGRSKGLRCKGNMEMAERLNEQTGEWESRTCPCEHYKSDENPKGECTEQGILIFILPKVNMGGTWQLRTGSYHSVVDVNSGLDYVRALIGRISMVPLKLKRVARETHADGKKQIHYTLSLTLDATIEGVNQLRSDTSRILSHAQLQIEGPVEENPVLDPPDVTEIDDRIESVEAADLAEMDDKELADVQKKLLEQKRGATPAKAAVPQVQGSGAGAGAHKTSEPDSGTRQASDAPVPKSWKEILDFIGNDSRLTDIKDDWKATNNVDNLSKLNKAGQDSLLQFIRANAINFPY